MRIVESLIQLFLFQIRNRTRLKFVTQWFPAYAGMIDCENSSKKNLHSYLSFLRKRLCENPISVTLSLTKGDRNIENFLIMSGFVKTSTSSVHRLRLTINFFSIEFPHSLLCGNNTLQTFSHKQN